MCGSLGCSLRSLPALVPTWCIRNTSTGRGSSLTKRVFLLCWFCFMPSRRVDFVRHSFVVLTCPAGSRLLRSLFNLCGDSVFFSADSSHGVHYHFIHMLAIATKFISVAVQPFVPTQRRSCSNILRFLFLRPLLYLILLGFLRHA